MAITKNRLFTLTIFTDSGTESKTGNIHINSIIAFISVIIITFFVCLFFIIGYQIKLVQEKNYKRALKNIHITINRLSEAEKKFRLLSNTVERLHHEDKAYRIFSILTLPDNQIYMAGIGGHHIIDESLFIPLENNIRNRIKPVALGIKSLEQQIKLEKKSINSIWRDLQLKIEHERYTPTILPTYSINVTSPFGTRYNPVTGERQFHDAVDFAGNIGEPVFSTAAGIITEATFNEIRGYYIEIEHKYGYKTLYAHLDKMMVAVGDTVNKGVQIGNLGKSGRTTGANLHYSISFNDIKINPLRYY